MRQENNPFILFTLISVRNCNDCIMTDTVKHASDLSGGSNTPRAKTQEGRSGTTGSHLLLKLCAKNMEAKSICMLVRMCVLEIPDDTDHYLEVEQFGPEGIQKQATRSRFVEEKVRLSHMVYKLTDISGRKSELHFKIKFNK